MTGQGVTKSDHDRVVTYIAANRFPFPDQTDWPADYLTITNEPDQWFGIPTPDGAHYPDIVVIDGNQQIQEVGEVEVAVDSNAVVRWKIGSDAAGPIPETGVKHFFVYVPVGQEQQARKLLEENQISYAGVRAYQITADDAISIIPIATPGHRKDHR